jgi:uncharacterized repeat protein (TIGR02543 family)
VTFFQNDSPTDQTSAGQTANVPTALTLFASLNPSFGNPGYAFNDWSTTPSFVVGSTSYMNGALYSFASVLSLYAQWTPDVYTLTYIAGGGSLTPGSVSYTVGTNALTLATPTLSGYSFNGWNTAFNGSGASYAAGGTFTPISNVTLFAQWTIVPIVPSVTVNFVANGASGSIAPITEAGGTSITLPSDSALTYPGYTFAGWNTAALGSGTNYPSASPLVATTSLTLYAQWTKMAGVTINFAPNGGTGSVTALSGTSGASITLPGGTGLSYVGHTFASWNTMADGSGTVFNVNSTLTLSGSTTLYAQWDPLLAVKSPNVLIGAVGAFANNSSRLTINLRTQVLRLAKLTKSSHFAAETLYGYTTDTGSMSSQLAISNRRASVVANYLRVVLASLHVNGVKITSAGEGAFKTGTGSTFRRVEVFVNG